MNLVYLGDRKVLLEKAKKDLSLESAGQSFDVFEIDKQQIAVYDIRQVISFAGKTSEKKKIIYLSSFIWSAEVQNAILKTLEETPKNTTIYLFGISEKNFLPTILSRVQKKQIKNSNRYLDFANEILSLNPNERLEHKGVKKLLALTVSDYDLKKDEEGGDKKDKESHVLFLEALIAIVLENKQKLKIPQKMLEQILQTTTLADIQGGSPTLFISWALLTFPKVEYI